MSIFPLNGKIKFTLKVFLYTFFLLTLAYTLLSIFAPGHARRLANDLRHLITPGAGRPFSLATAGRGGHYYRIGRLIAAELAKQQRRKLEAKVTSGTLENLELLRRGSVDFALVQGGFPVTNQDGENFDDLTALANIGRQYVHIITKEDSGIRAFSDLAGKTVSLGLEQSGNRLLGETVFDYYRFSPAVRFVYTDFDNLGKDLEAGKMDAVFAVYDLHAPVLEELFSSGSYRLIPISGAQAAAYTIPGCFAAQLPPGLYGTRRDIPPLGSGEFPTLAVNTLLITRRDMSPGIIRDILEMIYSTAFIKLSKLPELEEAKGKRVFDLPLHAEAKRFYRRNAPVTSDKYEIGSALLAGLLFIISIIGYFINRNKARLLQHQKKNIIPYFEEMVKFGKQLSESQQVEELRDLLDRMMATQRRAEREWLVGKLDTEHMENLYVVYSIRCENAFNKIMQLQNKRNRLLMEEVLGKVNNTKDAPLRGVL